MSKTKMTVKIYRPLLNAFNVQMNALFFKRDAFLNHMINAETPHLISDLKGQRLSSKARKYISISLNRMDLVVVNIVVDIETADAINEVVKKHNIVRDAFINRLIMFLRSSDTVLDYFGLDRTVGRNISGLIYESVPTSPLKAIESVYMDPFYYLRIMAKNHMNLGLYELDMPPRLIGFSCYISDYSLPGSEENIWIKDVMDSMDDKERDAFRDTD